MDSDAVAYIAAVETADGQSLQYPVKLAIDAFIVGCKADGTWTAIKAACLLAGPRTLSGALVPLVGAAPTNVNFVSGDYSQFTGLVGNGSTKYLNSNRNNNVDPQNNSHQSVWVSSAHGNLTVGAYIGAGSGADSGATHFLADRQASNATPWIAWRNRQVSFQSQVGATVTGLIGHSRTSASDYTSRAGGTSTLQTSTSQTPVAVNSFVFARNSAGSPNSFANARLSWYSIGEALNLALLDARLTTYMSDVLKPITNQRRAAQRSIRSTF